MYKNSLALIQTLSLPGWNNLFQNRNFNAVNKVDLTAFYEKVVH